MYIFSAPRIVFESNGISNLWLFKILLIACFFSIAFNTKAQYKYQFLNHRQDAYRNASLYSINDSSITGVRPFAKHQEKTPLSNEKGFWTWMKRKAFEERLVQAEGEGFSLSFDPIVNFNYGSSSGNEDFNNSRNGRGFLVEGTIGSQFSYYSFFSENQANFSPYVNSFIQNRNVVPGYNLARPFGDNGWDFSLVMGEVNYTPNQFFSFTLGQGKNFFGEGYRSMFLSDVSNSYPFFRIETEFWRVKYVNLWAQMYDAPIQSRSQPGYDKKYMSAHYLNIRLTNKWNLGFYESIIFGDTTQQRGLDASFFNPIIFYRPVEFGVGSQTGNALLGVSTSYKLKDGLLAYSQFIIDEFTLSEIQASNGYWANKWGLQIGLKYYNAFAIENLFLRLEYNRVRPYTYTHRNRLTNYGQYGQSLAHPWGANFSEIMLHSLYRFKKYEFEFRYHYGQQGLDAAGENYGSDIFRSYNSRESDYGNKIGQGQKSDLHYLELRAAYIINPVTDLKFEAGYVYRDRSLSNSADISGAIQPGTNQYWYVGLRTEILNDYFDF